MGEVTLVHIFSHIKYTCIVLSTNITVWAPAPAHFLPKYLQMPPREMKPGADLKAGGAHRFSGTRVRPHSSSSVEGEFKPRKTDFI